MNKLITFTVILTFCLIILFPIILSFGIRYIPSGIQPSLGIAKKIYKDYVLSQDFISLEDRLVGIGTSIKNPNFANKKNAIINIYDDNNNLIRTVTISGKNIADGDFVKILFQPIENSKNKKFAWTISSPESSTDDALEIFLTDDKVNWSLQLKVNNGLVKQTIPFVTFHKPKNLTQVFSIILSDVLSRFKEDWPFAVSYTLIVLGLSGTIIYQTIRGKRF
jgi:hypothetical protein